MLAKVFQPTMKPEAEVLDLDNSSSMSNSDGSSREWRAVMYIAAAVVIVLRVNNHLSSQISPASTSPSEGGVASAAVIGRSQHAYVERRDGGGARLGGVQLESRAAKRRVELPPWYENVAELTDPPVEGGSDIPFFFHIPRAGGSTVRDILGECLGLTLAGANTGVLDEHEHDAELGIVRVPGGRQKYVNVDTMTMRGIERAKTLRLADAGVASVISASRLGEAARALFDPPETRGKMFAMFRHPMDRAVSLFYYKWEKTHDSDPTVGGLRDFLMTTAVENNWMTRTIIDKMEGKLYLDDLEQAKEVLRRKCLVGLIEHKGESMRRFERFFGWENEAGRAGAHECEERLLHWGWSNKNQHPPVEEGSEPYELIRAKNEFDIQLYLYVQELFEEQGKMLNFFQHSERGRKRGDDASSEAIDASDAKG